MQLIDLQLVLLMTSFLSGCPSPFERDGPCRIWAVAFAMHRVSALTRLPRFLRQREAACLAHRREPGDLPPLGKRAVDLPQGAVCFAHSEPDALVRGICKARKAHILVV